MTELSATPIAETTYDNVLTHDGTWAGGLTSGSPSGLDLLDLRNFNRIDVGVYAYVSLEETGLSGALSPDPPVLIGRQPEFRTHRFSNVDDIVFGSSLNQAVILESTPSSGYGAGARIPVIEAGTQGFFSTQQYDITPYLSISAGALSDSFDRYEMNLETGMLIGMNGASQTASFGRYLNFDEFYFFDDIAITVQGTSGDDDFYTATASALINAGAGNDEIGSGTGDETINGGDGNDEVGYYFASSGVTVYLEHTGRNVGGGMGADHLTSIESLSGSNYADRFVGDASDNSFYGWHGADFLKGKDGDDVLNGASGADRIDGGSGDDRGWGGDGVDTVFGGSGADTLNGEGHGDFLYGGRGNDQLSGGDGADRLRGNRDNDTLLGGEGDDTLFGGGHHDSLQGNNGQDYLLGENGNDWLYGGFGDDTMSGGAGSDVFLYDMRGFDRIKDFENGSDQIDFTGAVPVSNFGDVLAVAQGKWGGVVLDFGNDNVLFLENMDFADFDASDVIL